jgi:hypothetical protein
MKNLKIIFTLAITIIILFILFSKIDLKNIRDIFQVSNKSLIILSAAILFISPLIAALRWKIVLNLLGLKVNFSDAAKIYLANYPISKVTPANSGDALRAFYFRDKLPASKQLGGVLSERLFDIAVLAILSLIGAIITRLETIAYLNIAILAGIAAFFVFAPKLKFNLGSKWNERINNFFYFFKILLKNPKPLLLIAVITVIIWLNILIHIKLSFLAFNADVPFISILTIQPVAIFVGLLPITFSGIGAREPAMIFLYSKLVAIPTALTVGLVYSFVAQILISIFCLPFTYAAWNWKKPKD